MDSDAHLISWDAGTGSCRCPIANAQGRQLALARGLARVMRAEDVPGSWEFDPQQMWDTFVQLT